MWGLLFCGSWNRKKMTMGKIRNYYNILKSILVVLCVFLLIYSYNNQEKTNKKWTKYQPYKTKNGNPYYYSDQRN